MSLRRLMSSSRGSSRRLGGGGSGGGGGDGGGAGSNPILDDDELQTLMQDLNKVDSTQKFDRWRASFLLRFESFLGESGARNATERYKKFGTEVRNLMKMIRQIHGMIEDGSIGQDRVTVRAQKTLSNCKAEMRKLNEDMQTLLPATSNDESVQGYTKFNIAAVLVRDGFQDYETLIKADTVLLRLSKTRRFTRCVDKQIPEEMDYFHTKFLSFVDILADLGLQDILDKCEELESEGKVRSLVDVDLNNIKKEAAADGGDPQTPDETTTTPDETPRTPRRESQKQKEEKAAPVVVAKKEKGERSRSRPKSRPKERGGARDDSTLSSSTPSKRESFKRDTALSAREIRAAASSPKTRNDPNAAGKYSYTTRDTYYQGDDNDWRSTMNDIIGKKKSSSSSPTPTKSPTRRSSDGVSPAAAPKSPSRRSKNRTIAPEEEAPTSPTKTKNKKDGTAEDNGGSDEGGELNKVPKSPKKRRDEQQQPKDNGNDGGGKPNNKAPPKSPRKRRDDPPPAESDSSSSSSDDDDDDSKPTTANKPSKKPSKARSAAVPPPPLQDEAPNKANTAGKSSSAAAEEADADGGDDGARIAVVTGASQGMGQAIAVKLVLEGCKVILLDVKNCDKTFRKISACPNVKASKDVAYSLSCDVTDDDQVKKALRASTRYFGVSAIDIVVHNAARSVFKSIEIASFADWMKSMQGNLVCHAMVTKHCLSYMKKAGKGRGSIIFQTLLDDAGDDDEARCTTCATTTGAMVHLARNCARDLEKYSIRVNSIGGPSSGEMRNGRSSSCNATATEVAEMVAYFAGDKSGDCTGTHREVG